jgi:hypothetical protein
MQIKLDGETFTLSLTSAEEDETHIEALVASLMPLTPEIQAHIESKYGTVAERQARKLRRDNPENSWDRLLERLEAVEAEVARLKEA